MTTVGNLLAPRDRLLTISPRDSVSAAIDKTIVGNVSALPVIANGQLEGVVTERDFVRRILALRIDPQDALVEQIMTRDLITVSNNSSIENCMALMIQHRIRHMLVVDEGELLGILSIRDMVQHVLREMEFEIEQLHIYVSRSY
jgi:CBS domain-containing protein